MRSHDITRALAACAASLCLTVLAACGGGGSEGADTPVEAKSEAQPEALRAARPGELAAYFRSRIVQSNLEGQSALLENGDMLMHATTSSPGAAYSGTNLQEAGVDEDDLLKTDGSFVYALHPAYPTGANTTTGRLEARRIQPDGSLGAAAGVALDPQTWATGMYLTETAQRLVVLGQRQQRQQLSLDIYDVSNDAQPAHATQVLIDGSAVSTRRIGNILYVASTWQPDLSPYWPPYGTPVAQYEAAVAGLDASALLPTIRTSGGPAQPLVAEQDCQLQPANASRSLQITTITAIDLSTPALERRSRCFIGDGSTLYMSPTAAYVVTSRNYWVGGDVMIAAVMPQQATTDIHKFALQGLQIDYRGSAEVTGHLGWDAEKTPYRMSEYQGDLRVLTFTGSMGWGWDRPNIDAPSTAATTQAQQVPPSPALLTVLREDPAAGRLAQVATLPNSQRPAPIGHEGEQVYAVQFAGPLAYVVTFRRTDPLYVLDLSDAADPKITGTLEMPGFSDYLFPLANGKFLGVGRDATATGTVQSLKFALFDVSDPARPLLLSSRTLGGRWSTSALDYSRHGINILQQGARARIALPVNLWSESVYAEGSTQQGLARYVVDTEAGTLEERPMVAATVVSETSNYASLWYERSIQTANTTYYLSGGEVSYIAEP